jgi:hypothetical protein
MKRIRTRHFIPAPPARVWAVLADFVSGAFGVKIPSYTQYAGQALNVFKDVFTIVTQTIIGLIDGIVLVVRQVIDWLRLFGTVANDVFTLNWGKIGSDWKSGMDRIASDAEADAKRVADAWRKAAEAVNDIRNGAKGTPAVGGSGGAGGGQSHQGGGHAGGGWRWPWGWGPRRRHRSHQPRQPWRRR